MARIQPTNIDSDAALSYDSAFLGEVQKPSTGYVNPLFAKDNQEQKYPKQSKLINDTIDDDQINSNIIFDEPIVDVNSGSVKYDNNVQASYELEQLARNVYKEAKKQQINANKVKQQNKVLTQQLEVYKEKDIIRDLEQQQDNLQLNVVELRRQIVELQKTQTILKRKMSENEDKYHDTVLDLEAKAKHNENVVLKMGQSLQGMFMLRPKPMSFYDPNVKHGLGYENPYTLKKTISQNPKIYDASCFNDTKMHVNVRDTGDILDDATKSQIKMENKLKDPIAIEKKQNLHTIDYNKLNALYGDFVPQKELFAEQKYFSSTFIPSENPSNARTSTSPSEIKPPLASMPKIRAENQDILMTISELKTKLKNVEKGKSVNTKFDKTNVSNKLICVTSLNKQDFQKKTVAPKTEEKHVLSKTVTLQTSPNKQKAVETNKNVIAPGMYKVNNINKHETNTNKAKSVLSSTRLKAALSVRIPLNRDSSFKNSVLSNTKKSSEKVEFSDRTNNVVLNKKIVTDVDFKNALKAKNVLCVSCAKNMLIPCHDKCLANYKLYVHSKVRRALFTTPRTIKSTFVDTTPVVSNTRFSVKTIQSKSLDTTLAVSKTKIAAVTPLSAKNKVSSTFKRITVILRESSIRKYMKNQIRTSRMWQKLYELQPNVGWSPIKTTLNVVNSSSNRSWIVDSGCSKHMTGDYSLLENFIEKFMGTVRFGNDHFAATTGYGDYVQGNITVCHVYYVEGLGYNLFNVGQFCDGDLEVAFRSKTCYV
ncbi:hypothetical protein Tco_0366628 [Tanacetum coccineum]